jgi:hypothetical protein
MVKVTTVLNDAYYNMMLTRLDGRRVDVNDITWRCAGHAT